MGSSPALSPVESNKPKNTVTKNRKLYRWPLITAGSSVAACAVLWLGWGMYLYWDDVRLVNFLAAWIPFVLSVLLAFVPEHKMSTWKKVVWRSGVIAAGFIWSVVLWHQQVVADMAAKKDQEALLQTAVTQSNQHSDQQFQAVHSDLQGVKKDVQNVKGDVRDIVNTEITKSTSVINENIGKVGKPQPPELARLVFSLYSANGDPVLSSASNADKDGNYPVDFYFTNVSGVTAETIDIWIQICTICSFATEPAGFDKPAGIDDHVRHKVIPALNSGVSFEKSSILVRVGPQLGKPATTFQIGFRYSCKTCGKMDKTSQFAMIQMKPKAPESEKDSESK